VNFLISVFSNIASFFNFIELSLTFKASTNYEWKKISNTAKSEDINLTVLEVIPPGVNFTNKVAQN
jgi:hypothetical protein